jgi:hypothetical protein
VDDTSAFSEIIRGAMPDRVISNFVLVCEVLTEDGAELTIATSDAITPWLGLGMLVSATNMLQETATGEDED